MSFATPAPLLRFALRLDAVISAATGLMLCPFSAWWAEQLALPQALLLGAGLICLPYAAFLFALSRRATISRITIFSIIIGNLLWADVAMALMFGYGAAPNAAGVTYLATHVFATGSFAVLQWFGWRKSAGKNTPGNHHPSSTATAS